MGSQSKAVKEIRRKIKNNPSELIGRFNTVLRAVRTQMIEQNIAKDIIFVVDGSDRLKNEKYHVFEQLFITNVQLIHSVNANMIFGVPIDSIYDIRHADMPNRYDQFVLPMIRLNAHNSSKLLQSALTKMH